MWPSLGTGLRIAGLPEQKVPSVPAPRAGALPPSPRSDWQAARLRLKGPPSGHVAAACRSRDLSLASAVPACGFVPCGCVAAFLAGTPAAGAMAPPGRKRKAGAAPGEAAEGKRGRLAEGAALLIEHW